MAKNKTKKIITAGLLVVEAVYPRADRHDSDKVRAAKRKVSSEAQKRMNMVYSYQKLEFQLAANYRPGDLWITLTYDDAHLPKSEKEANQCVKYFLQKLREERRKRGQTVVAHWNTEHKHRHESYWEDRRWHHHLPLNATGDDYELIRKCWIYGSNIDIRPLRLDKDNSYEAMARYMCKEAPEKKVGKHCWHHTRNIKHPEIETFRVENDETVQAPKGALILDEGGDRNILGGTCRVVKYLVPGWDRAPKLRAKRSSRRRKR